MMSVATRSLHWLRVIPLVSVFLAACSLTPPIEPTTSPTSPQWHSHVQAVQQITHYQARGAFAYLTETQKVYARFFWQQFSPKSYRLLLTSPLGSTELELRVDNNVAQLTDNQGKQYTNNDPEKMLNTLTGMNIPLDSLRQWLLGLPGGRSTFTLDDQYRLKTLSYQQAGNHWQVSYQRYDSNITPTLPQRFELQQNDRRIKLKIDSWTLK